MSLPPVNPEKTASGIIQDPRTLERIVPTSKRSDGSVRKELKIRPGFTPQEDIGRFRSNRQVAADARKGLVPGSNRPPPPKQPDPDNVFAQPAKEKSKAQLKNEKRREKKRLEASNKDWDDDEDGDEHVLEDGQTAVEIPGSKEATGGGIYNPEDSFTPFSNHGTPDPPAIQPKSQGSNIPASKPSDGANINWADMDDSPVGISASPPSAPELASAIQASASTSKSNPSEAAANSRTAGPAAKRHPIQGGRDGPLGLAHPPPIEQSKSDKATSWRKEKPPAENPGKGAGAKSKGKSGNTKPAAGPKGAAEPPKPTSEPRVRKEVKIRQGGVNDIGSLASRVRSLVLENQKPAAPRAKKENAAES
ncbi:hypothetical protein BD324DRAFT_621921 [Kockovaella imperatae]|uniref:WIBG Mago-binding domain-containing protein n=1 Tax=Kockovaella imperatae TaxID=4999 RepID=A0A1Y1UKV6_9TREE|nr:hypothetical protein BD324DRAFT_621921 [Kockovaella imperatae]ORX38681.1 hypothetical protein BD324DRAFT_621921 [Kockovaella imperatae]